MSEKSIGSIIDSELAKIDLEMKRLEKLHEKLGADLAATRMTIKEKERELATTETSILEITRERGRVIKRALAEAGISLEPVVRRARASGGPGVVGLRGGAPQEVLAFIVSKGSATTAEISVHFANAEFAKRIAAIVSGALKKKGYIDAQRAETGRGSVFTATETGKAELA